MSAKDVSMVNNTKNTMAKTPAEIRRAFLYVSARELSLVIFCIDLDLMCTSIHITKIVITESTINIAKNELHNCSSVR